MSVAGKQKNMTLGFLVPLTAMLTEKPDSKPIRILRYQRRGCKWYHTPFSQSATATA